MSQASAQSSSGNVSFADPNAAQSNWVLWGIGGLVILALVFALAQKGK